MPAQLKRGLEASYEALSAVPDGFALFVAVHDFVVQLESHPAFQKVQLPAKYSHFRDIFQGIEDMSLDPRPDLGHDRNMVVQDLLRIRDHKNLTDGNPLWKKRSVLRRFATDIYKLLKAEAVEPKLAD